ncbi:MAG TPA: hypothetical protein VMN57_07400 [Anaerolineales bacterium]|nr:hypothetical protein [Anaerolineales bacterium]
MRERFKQSVPVPLLTTARETRDWLRRVAAWPTAAFHPLRRESIRRLGELKDAHKGQRCFIIGNGPSLKNTDLSRLRGEYTFGMNRVYLAFEDWGFTTSYLVAVNTLVIEQCAPDLLALPVPVFLSWRSRKSVASARRQAPGTRHQAPETRDPIYLHTTYSGPRFATDARGRLWEGATVTYVCLQLAFHMGFETAVLIGVDHSFKSTGTPNTTVTSLGDDPDHFDPGYFGAGFRWQLPDLDTSETGYRMAERAYESAGRRVLDATVGGKLEVFEKVEYDELFS